MNKSELIEVFAERTGLSSVAADKVVNEIFSCMKETLIAGGRIEIRGFGCFEVRHYDGYTGRNPKTGDSVAVKPKKMPFFRTGKELKERILGT